MLFDLALAMPSWTPLALAGLLLGVLALLYLALRHSLKQIHFADDQPPDPGEEPSGPSA